ncbi:hypothetical protein A5660_10240 [Mycobacterium alsense]|nr:hypothetical protein A5660_10240 [Mycobacterium alsense]
MVGLDHVAVTDAHCHAVVMQLDGADRCCEADAPGELASQVGAERARALSDVAGASYLADHESVGAPFAAQQLDELQQGDIAEVRAAEQRTGKTIHQMTDWT